MKLSVEFRKEENGNIRVVILVEERGDYPTFNLFEDTTPLQKGWKIKGEKKWRFVEHVLPTPEEAERWACEQISIIREALEEWRKIRVPKPYKVEV